MASGFAWSAIPPPCIEAVAQSFAAVLIPSDTYIRILPADNQHKIFFTADGSNPVPSVPTTHRYYAPFKLLPGSRMVKAIAVCRRSGVNSGITLKSFEVVSAMGCLDDSHSSSSVESVTDFDGVSTFRSEGENGRQQDIVSDALSDDGFDTYQQHPAQPHVATSDEEMEMRQRSGQPGFDTLSGENGTYRQRSTSPRHPETFHLTQPRSKPPHGRTRQPQWEVPPDQRLQQNGAGVQLHNGSGTQVNYWGTPAGIGLENGKGIPPRAPVKSTLQPEVRASKTKQTMSIKPKQQQEQQFGIRKFFSGWFGSGKDSKQVDIQSITTITGAKSGKFKEVQRSCQKKKILWEDPDFPCSNSSLFYDQPPVEGDIEWKRPSEICSSPRMFVGGAGRFDIEQGALGNCWLLASISTLTTKPKLLDKVVPKDQEFNKNYAGVFRFYFWQYGEWLEVLVDDRLPTCQGQLVYMHSASGNEFWSALAEKAFAKLAGCYENLSSGTQSESFTDLTGGLCETYNFKEDLPSNMFKIMLKSQKNSCLMGCSIDVGSGPMEEQLSNGLVVGHAYSVTDVKQLETEDGDFVELVRCRNPWGNECEWSGDWADGSEEWESISEEDQQTLGLVRDHDGEFWMSFKDFAANFSRLEICHVRSEGAEGGRLISGSWKKKVNAGGCRNNTKTFPSNPQYTLDLVDPDEDDEEDLCTIIVALMQKNRRRLKQQFKQGKSNLTIGYEIYQLVSGVKDLKMAVNKGLDPTATSPSYIDQREIVGRHQLPPGHYIVVPTTFEPDEEADFELRIFTEGPTRGLGEVNKRTALVQAQQSAPVKSAKQTHGIQEAKALFLQYGGEDQEIDAQELQNVLSATFSEAFKCGTFDMHVCRSLIAMADADMTGKLNLEEFKKLWADLQNWQSVFRQYDQDHSGQFNSLELREALRMLGYSLSNGTFRAVATRFSEANGTIDFDNFVACVVKMKTMYDVFLTKAQDGKAEFSTDEFIQMTMYT